MQLKVKLTLQDYRTWVYDFAYGGMRGKITVAAYTTLFISGGLYYLIENGLGKTVPSAYFFVLLFVVLLGLLTPSILFFTTKNTFESDKLVQEEIDYEIDDNGLKVKASYGNADLTWDKIYGAYLHRKYIGIALAKNKAYVLPIRFFKDINEAKELAELLMKKLPNKNIRGKFKV